jgi:hypothetical protein
MAATSTPQGRRLDEVARLIDAEFNEMPGTRLTAAQVRRLWNLTDRECAQALDYLSKTGFLVRDRQGRYVRRDLEY